MAVLWWYFRLTSLLLGDRLSPSRANEDTFFKEEAFTASAYVHFRSNGTYSRIDREHMFVEESDRGTWTHTQTLGYHEVRCALPEYRSGPLGCMDMDTNIVKRIASGAGALPACYARTDRNNTSSRTLSLSAWFCFRRAERTTTARSPSILTRSKISRGQLGLLLHAIRTFTIGRTIYCPSCCSDEVKEITFLLWRDEGTALNGVFRKIKKSIDRLKRRRKEKGSPCRWLYRHDKRLSAGARRSGPKIHFPVGTRDEPPAKRQTDGQK